MRKIILFALLIISTATIAQNNKWQLSVQLQPEITFYKDKYLWGKEQKGKATINPGVAVGVQYNINKRLFVNGGVGFTSKKMNTSTRLNQALLPPPKQSYTLELVTTQSVTYRIISIPVNVGYNFFYTNKLNSFVTAGIAANYLLNAEYETSFSRYNGTYKKNYWQGCSVNMGVGADYKLSKKITATAAFTYAVVNTVKTDKYLYSKSMEEAALTNNFLSVGIGFKFQL